MNQTPQEVLDTMLGFLGFITEIQEQQGDHGQTTLQVFTAESECLIGKNGATLEDLQYLLNRILHQQEGGPDRVTVDVEHFRTMRNDHLIHRMRSIADHVRQSGEPAVLEPMNSYDRRLVHNAFFGDPDIMTRSPKDDARLKRITIKRRGARE